MAHSMSTRECCVRCGRPLACCLCESLPPAPLELATRVLILQHYKELSKGIGTVQLLRPLLANLTIVQPLSGAEALACGAIPSGADEMAVLLYPPGGGEPASLPIPRDRKQFTEELVTEWLEVQLK